MARNQLSFFQVSRTLGMAFVLGAAAVVFTGQPAAAKKLSDRKLAVKECGACHYFYSNRFLPAYSWKKIIDNLDNHFGEDASLDEASRKRILSYMVGNRSVDIPIRITDTGWWKQAHGTRVVMYAKKNKIRVSECGKCHR